MTELKDPTPPDTAGDEGPDPLASLHKMSTTAGITSQDYVAINIPSIVALILGMASLLSPVSPVLLLLPVAGIIVGLVSLSQIRASNGTQTGRGFAIGGIVLSLLIGGFVLARAVVERNRTAGDRDAIVRKIEELGKVIGARDYDRAYGLFSDRFHNRIKRSAFDAAWDQWQGNPSLGHITAMKWNQTNIIFQDEPGSGTRVASAYAWLDFEKGSEKARQPLVFRKVNDQWVIDDAPMVFPPERRTRPRGQAQ